MNEWCLIEQLNEVFVNEWHEQQSTIRLKSLFIVLI
jgi:hypothetical protein